jgi:hypothetical protein
MQGIYLLVVLLLASASAQTGCTFNSSQGLYDFTHFQSADWSFTNSKGTYYFRVCSPVSSPCGSGESSVCLQTPDGVQINEGTTKSAIWTDRESSDQKGVTILYSQGDICGPDQSRRKTVVHLNCQYLDQINGRIESVDDTDDCETVINIPTSFACPADSRLSDCGTRSDREACFEPNDCSCAWCDSASTCVAQGEPCTGILESECEGGFAPVMRTIVCVTIGLVFVVALCLCIRICRQKKQNRHKIQQKLEILPNRKQNMEPLLLRDEFPMQTQQPQFVYVQMPMPGTDQHAPPYFAPQPFFLAPQYVQQMQEQRK